MKARWRMFADGWLKSWNATDAYSLAYPNCTRETARRNGHKLLSNTDILAYIREHQMKPEEILGRLEDQAQGAEGYFDYNTGQLEIRRLIADGKGHLIKKQKRTMTGVEVELYDAQRALELLGKHQKLFTDKTEIDIGDRLAAKLEAYTKAAEKIYAQPGSGRENSTDGA